MKNNLYIILFKRIFDFLFSLTLILLISPCLLLLIFLLFFSNRFNVFFVQSRPGKYGRIFKLIKFKTMTDEKDANGNLLHDSQRLTKIGKFLRSTSLDELPQLINVLKGDMSLIGPRPLLIKYLPLYSARQARRHEVRPGITGWAQVNGRNAISWQERFDLDVWYVENVSFFLDMKILLLTVFKVIKREGISSSTSVTMEAFRGND
ncbi:MAG: sugar transferase [Ignavibacteriales bacterium]|nr:MAG: sugar transferase [Ignavibacteriales bacterium]